MTDAEVESQNSDGLIDVLAQATGQKAGTTESVARRPDLARIQLNPVGRECADAPPDNG